MNILKINSETFTPINDIILVKIGRKQNSEKKTESGIIMVSKDNANVFDRETGGEVIRVGKNVDEIKSGDKVWFELHAGIDAEDEEGFAYTILRVRDIIGYERPLK